MKIIDNMHIDNSYLLILIVIVSYIDSVFIDECHGQVLVEIK